MDNLSEVLDYVEIVIAGNDVLKNLRTQMSVPAPPRWKMAVVVFIAAYAISSLSRSILNPFLAVAITWQYCNLYCDTCCFTYIFCNAYTESFAQTVVICEKSLYVL